MPELPEVETIRRQLAPDVEGMTIVAIDVADVKWTDPLSPSDFAARLSGRQIRSLGRRGKYLIAALNDGSALVMHLRMTGNLLRLPDGEAMPDRHLRGTLWLEASDGAAAGSLAFTDPRRFGTAQLFESEHALTEYLDERLGPEPFDPTFDAALLHARTRGRRTSIKAVLLDQRVVAGIGNIYADEALHRAEVAPTRRADRLTRASSELLVESIRDALAAGIDAKGATIDDFRDAYGVAGSFQDQFLVHRREGLPCPRCEAPVIKIRCAGRGTYYCRSCQR